MITYEPNELVKLLLAKGYTKYPLSYDGDYWFCYIQMAMKWLREVHKWHIEISRGEYGYFVHIVSAKNLSTENYAVRIEGGYNLSYEEACEAGIKYCLENLI